MKRKTSILWVASALFAFIACLAVAPRAAFAATNVRSFSIDKTSIKANGADVETARLTLSTDDPAMINFAGVIVNLPSRYPNTAHGYFQWTQDGGFQSVGGGFYNQQSVTILPENAANPNQGSQRLVDPDNGIVTFVFRWTANPSYGTLTANTPSYYYVDTRDAVPPYWKASSTSFSVTSDFTPPTFRDLIIEKPRMQANGTDVEAIHLIIAERDASAIDSASIIINNPSGSANQCVRNQARGYFEWRQGRGFSSTGGAYYGQQLVNLLPANAANPRSGSERLVHSDAGTVEFVFRFAAYGASGNVSANAISYSYAASAKNFDSGWSVSSRQFDIVSPDNFVSPVVSDLSVSTSTIDDTNTEEQIATLTINTTHPSTLDGVILAINNPTGYPNDAMGYFVWKDGRGFWSDGGGYYGQQHVRLLNVSIERDSVNDQFMITFHWTKDSTTGPVQWERVSFMLFDSAHNYSSLIFHTMPELQAESEACTL